jgi:GTP-binding protein
MKDLDEAAVSYQVILTKCDKVKPNTLANLTNTTASRIAKHVAAHPTIIQTSSVKNEGLDVLRTELAMMADIR